MKPPDLGQFPMLALFREEVETQTHVLTVGLLALERGDAAADQLESCMRAAHSLKGAARIVGLAVCVRLAHALEDCFVAAQQGRITLLHPQIDCLLGGVDLLKRVASAPEADLPAWADKNGVELDACLSALECVLEGRSVPSAPTAAPAAQPEERPLPAADASEASDRVLRVTAESLNRLLNLPQHALDLPPTLEALAAALE